MEDIGNIIKERRNTLSITQRQLAELAGVALIDRNNQFLAGIITETDSKEYASRYDEVNSRDNNMPEISSN